MTYQRITWLLPVLRDAGIPVATVSGWESRGRPPSTGDSGPYVGVGNHHTGTKTPGPHPTLGMVTRGRADLPGPLCHILYARDGVAWLVAAGRANHAGLSNGAGLLQPGDGNHQLVGIEVEHDGLSQLTPAQSRGLPRLNAAILRKLEADQRGTFLHATWSVTGKWDLAEDGHTINLPHLRDQVAGELTRLAPRPPSRDRTDLPVVDLSRALRAFKADRKRRGDGTYPAGVRLIEAELEALGFLVRRLADDGYAGQPTVDAYKQWQHKLGYRGADADGQPGMTSLVRLGHRRGRFAVTA